MYKVYIVGGGGAYEAMFKAAGWELASCVSEADLVQFTGGHDVSPHLYGEELHPLTNNSEARDEYEMEVFREAQQLGIACAGICRGGQFLNVMNGGKMWQHVDNHAVGQTHRCYSEVLGEFVQVTSTHHQMMDPAEHGEVEGYVNGLAGPKQWMDRGTIGYCTLAKRDVEVVYYRETDCLCFQPHPEFYGAHETRNYYFKLIEYYFGFVS